jgi:hypothetical protein
MAKRSRRECRACRAGDCHDCANWLSRSAECEHPCTEVPHQMVLPWVTPPGTAPARGTAGASQEDPPPF